MMRLLQFRHSHYNEKVRWALDFKRVAHRRESLLPGPHAARLRKLTGRSLTPTLVTDDGTAIDQSRVILEWLEAHHPQPALFPDDAAERAQADALCRKFDDDIAPRGRRAVLACLLRTPRYFARVFADGRGRATQALYGAVVPLAAPLVRKGNGIRGPASIDDGMAALQEGLDLVARTAAASGYLVGGRFGVADLTAAAVLAICVDPPDSPMCKPQPRSLPYQALVDTFARHPGALWVREIYARHRGAGRDFDGPSPY